MENPYAGHRRAKWSISMDPQHRTKTRNDLGRQIANGAFGVRLNHCLRIVAKEQERIVQVAVSARARIRCIRSEIDEA